MKNKLTYYLSILLIGSLIFLYIRSQQELPLNTTQEYASTSNVNSPSSSKANQITTTILSANLKTLVGDYWNHSYIKEDPDMSDIAVTLKLNSKNQLEAHFLYYESIEFEGEEMGIQQDGGSTTLTPLSDSVLIVNNPMESFIGEFLYIIRIGDQIGLSLDGKQITYYKKQYISPDLSPQALIKHFYGHITGAHTVKEGRTQNFTAQDTDYSLVFFEENHGQAYGYRYGSNASFLSVAKFRKEASGMHFINFVESCPCGYYKDIDSGNDIKIYPTLQKIGHKYFLLKKIPERDGTLNKTVLYVYDVDEFKEILAVDLEVYEEDASGKKEYTLKNFFSFAEEDCAIIIQKNPSLEEQNNFELKQDIYLFEEDNNTFVKVD